MSNREILFAMIAVLGIGYLVAHVNAKREQKTSEKLKKLIDSVDTSDE